MKKIKLGLPRLESISNCVLENLNGTIKKKTMKKMKVDELEENIFF
jgi:hypothetical protein